MATYLDDCYSSPVIISIYYLLVLIFLLIFFECEKMRGDKRGAGLIIGAWSWVINHMTALFVVLDVKTSLSEETMISNVYNL